MYLIDTDVVSAAAPGRAGRNERLVEWMDRHSDDLYLSAITVTEIVQGIARLERAGALARAVRLRDWLDLLLHLYDARVLHFDVAAARLAGVLSDRARASDHARGFADIAIAATAASRGLTVLTRNLRHFGPLGIAAIDPFEELP